MMNAPKKIWMGDNAFAWAMEDDIFNIPYIREDLVLGLVEALELLVSYGNVFSYKAGQESPYEIARAALAKLEEE